MGYKFRVEDRAKWGETQMEWYLGIAEHYVQCVVASEKWKCGAPVQNY